MKNIIVLFILLAFLFVVSCASSTETSPAVNDEMASSEAKEHSSKPELTSPKVSDPATSEEVSEIINLAEAKRKSAAKLKHEWRHTAKRIKEAKDFLAKGDLIKAEAKARKALFESETAIWQHDESKNTWMLSVPHLEE